jgi:hypothetical protein
VRAAIAQASNARLVITGASAHASAIDDDVKSLVAALGKKAPTHGHYANAPAIVDRMKARGDNASPDSFVGLVNAATSSGVFENSAPGPGYTSTSDDALLDVLASMTYGGHGAHSIFMKTWAAGLAYSNGLHPQLANAQLGYYAERCPLLPQTLRFVIATLQAAKPDANIARYAVASAFSSRAADPYESRASAMANDLTDGEGPDVMRAFRKHLLALAQRPDIVDQLRARMPKVYGTVLPGLGKPAKNAIYFVIGPEPQLAAYDDYLKTAVPGEHVHRLYPRDFWVP